jgi:hypothetical protein
LYEGSLLSVKATVEELLKQHTFVGGRAILSIRLLVISFVGFTFALLGTGCAGVSKNWKKPHKMSHLFDHVVMSPGMGPYPSLAAAAPAAQRTPRRRAEAEKRAPLRPKTVASTVKRNQLELPAPTTPARLKKQTKAGSSGGGLDIEELPTPKKTATPRTAPAPATKSVKTPAKPKKGLGDGSVKGEMLAAAERLVGIKGDFDERGFLIHLLQVSDSTFDVPANSDVVQAYYERLNRKDRVFTTDKKPKSGDIVFFHNTYDRDKDGRADDWFTLAGVVTSVDGDGTVHFVSYAKGEIRRLVLNLEL